MQDSNIWSWNIEGKYVITKWIPYHSSTGSDFQTNKAGLSGVTLCFGMRWSHIRGKTCYFVFNNETTMLKKLFSLPLVLQYVSSQTFQKTVIMTLMLPQFLCTSSTSKRTSLISSLLLYTPSSNKTGDTGKQECSISWFFHVASEFFLFSNEINDDPVWTCPGQISVCDVPNSLHNMFPGQLLKIQSKRTYSSFRNNGNWKMQISYIRIERMEFQTPFFTLE